MIEATQDRATVTSGGESRQALPHGVSFKEVPTHIDERGSVCEMFDERWDWHEDPLVFAYCFTVRPGVIKGWGLHKLHEDRYFTLFGELEVVFYDERKDSPTRGLVSSVVLSHHNRRVMNIPAGVWHACRNVGPEDVVVINFPTIPYDHENPDKYRLPLDTDRIPYRFENAKGW